MRDGNVLDDLGAERLVEVVSLPMRDGNPDYALGRRRGLTVVSLPMRDGNNSLSFRYRSAELLLAYL